MNPEIKYMITTNEIVAMRKLTLNILGKQILQVSFPHLL